MNQQEKLRQRRLKEEEKIRKRRESLGIASRISKRIFSDFRHESRVEENPISEDVPIEEVEKTLEENAVEVKEETKISEAPPDETDEERINRLLKVRKEIFEKHTSVITERYDEAIKSLDKSFADKLSEAENEYKETLDSHKEDLKQALEDAYDAEEKREARKVHQENIKEEEDLFGETKKEIVEEHKTALEELKTELDDKITELKEQYGYDEESIKEDTYGDDDLELCQKEFEAETITFDSLEEYVDEEDSGYNSYSSNATESAFDGFNFFRVIPGLIGLAIVMMVGWQVLSRVQGALDSAGATSNVTTDGMVVITSITSIFGGINLTAIMLLFAPLFFIIIWKVMFSNRGGFV